MKKLVYGVGINDADYVVNVRETVGYADGKQRQKLIWRCPFFQTWKHMLERSYSGKWKTKYPTYDESVTLEEWHLFSAFKFWMGKQDWEDRQLDKDLLIRGNKIYSPEACVFVSRQVNMFVIDRGAARGNYLIGVSWHKRDEKFISQCSNPFTKGGEYLGAYDSELEAHKAWLAKKLEHAYALAALQTDERVAKALIDRYTNYN